MSLIEWNEKEFNNFIAQKESGVVEFGAPWCGSCKVTEPQLEELLIKHNDLKIVKIDVGKNPTLASKMGVMSLPNVIIFSEGKVVEQMIGMTTAKTLEEKLSKI